MKKERRWHFWIILFITIILVITLFLSWWFFVYPNTKSKYNPSHEDAQNNVSQNIRMEIINSVSDKENSTILYDKQIDTKYKYMIGFLLHNQNLLITQQNSFKLFLLPKLGYALQAVYDSQIKKYIYNDVNDVWKVYADQRLYTLPGGINNLLLKGKTNYMLKYEALQ